MPHDWRFVWCGAEITAAIQPRYAHALLMGAEWVGRQAAKAVF